MTALPASLLGIKNRGVIKVGNKADLAIFTDRFQDQATYFKEACATGLQFLFINGQAKVSQGEFITDIESGIIIK